MRVTSNALRWFFEYFSPGPSFVNRLTVKYDNTEIDLLRFLLADELPPGQVDFILAYVSKMEISVEWMIRRYDFRKAMIKQAFAERQVSKVEYDEDLDRNWTE